MTLLSARTVSVSRGSLGELGLVAYISSLDWHVLQVVATLSLIVLNDKAEANTKSVNRSLADHGQQGGSGHAPAPDCMSGVAFLFSGTQQSVCGIAHDGMFVFVFLHSLRAIV